MTVIFSTTTLTPMQINHIHKGIVYSFQSEASGFPSASMNRRDAYKIARTTRTSSTTIMYSNHEGIACPFKGSILGS